MISNVVTVLAVLEQWRRLSSVATFAHHARRVYRLNAQPVPCFLDLQATQHMMVRGGRGHQRGTGRRLRPPAVRPRPVLHAQPLHGRTLLTNQLPAQPHAARVDDLDLVEGHLDVVQGQWDLDRLVSWRVVGLFKTNGLVGSGRSHQTCITPATYSQQPINHTHTPV